jgi:hypothetical protein
VETTFNLSGVAHDRKSADDMREISAAIERLSARRKSTIAVSGVFLKSKLAWNIASYQEAVLWRVVMLARAAHATHGI